MCVGGSSSHFYNNTSVVETNARLTDTEKNRQGQVIQISDFTVSLNGVKIQNRSISQTPLRRLTGSLGDIAPSALHLLASSKSLDLFLHANTDFSSSLNVFLQQRLVCFSDRWQEACDGIRKKPLHY